MFRTVHLSIIRVFHCTHSNGTCHTGLLTACEQYQDGVPAWSCSQAIWHTPLLRVQWKAPDYGQRNCPKHVEFYSKNKFEKLVYLVGFIIRIYHDAPSPESQTHSITRVYVTWLFTSKDSLTTHAISAASAYFASKRCLPAYFIWQD